MDFDPESLAKSPFVIGGLGAVVGALNFAAPGATRVEKAINAVSGLLTAGYLTPPLCAYLRMTSPEYVGGASFVLGVLSMSLVDAAVRTVRDTRWGDIAASWFTRR